MGFKHRFGVGLLTKICTTSESPIEIRVAPAGGNTAILPHRNQSDRKPVALSRTFRTSRSRITSRIVSEGAISTVAAPCCQRAMVATSDDDARIGRSRSGLPSDAIVSCSFPNPISGVRDHCRIKCKCPEGACHDVITATVRRGCRFARRKLRWQSQQRPTSRGGRPLRLCRCQEDRRRRAGAQSGCFGDYSDFVEIGGAASTPVIGTAGLRRGPPFGKRHRLTYHRFTSFNSPHEPRNGRL
jgi:hypothetical protein